MKNKNMETRSFTMELREMDAGSGEFDGYASAFNVLIPGYNEKVMPGAFTQTLKHNAGQVPIFANHWSDSWIGWGLEAVEDKKGLKVRGKLFIDSNPQALAMWDLMKAADEMTHAKVGLSIGFRTLEQSEEVIKGQKIRIINEIALMEYSVTPFPANPKSWVTKVRAVDELANELRSLSADEYTELIALLEPASGDAHDLPMGTQLHSVAKRLQELNKQFKGG